MPSKRHRTPLQHARDKKIIASMYLQGYTQKEIAEKIGKTQPTVSRDLRGIHVIWERSSLVDFDALKRKELEKIDALELTYWRAWRDSGGEIVSTTIERVASEQGDGGTKRAKEVIKTENKVGDFAALRGVQWCIDKRCAIFGLDAPQKYAPTDPSGEKPYESPEHSRSMDAFFEAIRIELHGEGQGEESAMDASERETVASSSQPSG